MSSSSLFAQVPQPEAILPPSVLESPAPHYPESALQGGHEQSVVLHVTVGADGAVIAAHVDHSVGPDFDAAALEAIKLWKFSPARRGGVAVPSNVRVAVRFVPPDFDLSGHGPIIGPLPESHPPQAPPVAEVPAVAPAPQPAAPALPDAKPDTAERTALGAAAVTRAETVRPSTRGASDFVIERDVLDAAPHKDAASMLAAAPGVYVARGEGEAVAQHVFLRGFDAEHGQDIAFSAGGLPINLPSHLHGQGYADLSFIVPEVVRYVRVTEGVYDVRQGDFAVAGSVDYELGVSERGLKARTSYGSFNSFRQLLLWAPQSEPTESFGAATYSRTDGFGEHRDGQSAGVLAQHVIGTGAWRGRFIGSFHGARARLAGVLRQDDIDRGSVGFYDVYADPIAENQSAFSSEAKLGAFVEHRAHSPEAVNQASSRAGLWLGQNAFRLQEAFTGYTQRSQSNPEWAGRGDLIEQTNHTSTWGLTAGHRTGQYELASWALASLELGLQGRVDRIEQTQGLLQAPQNETWDQRIDAAIDGADIAGFAEVDLRLFHVLRLRGGMRASALYYSVDDRLGNFIPLFRRDSYIVGFRRSAFGLAAGPRASAELAMTPWLDVLTAYGHGSRSPQARLLEDGETAPFTTVRSADVGFRIHLAPDGATDRLVITTSAFHTSLSDDVAFEPAEGRLEPIGPTTRTGASTHAVVRPWSFLVGSASITYVRAQLDSPPPASAEDPAPPYREGQLLPYVPPWVVRLDLGAHRDLIDFDRAPVHGRIGFGLTHLSARPLPFDTSSDPVTLCDVSGSLRWRALELGIEAFNVLDAQYAATEHVFASNWDEAELPSRLPARHIAAGPPRSVMLTLGVTL